MALQSLEAAQLKKNKTKKKARNQRIQEFLSFNHMKPFTYPEIRESVTGDRKNDRACIANIIFKEQLVDQCHYKQNFCSLPFFFFFLHIL